MDKNEIRTDKKGNKFQKLIKFIKILLILAVLLAGIGGGLFMGGGIYALADNLAPELEKIPLIGPRVYPLLEKLSPAVTGYERRLMELEERETYLQEKARNLEEKTAELKLQRQKLDAEKELVEEKLSKLDQKRQVEETAEDKDNEGLFGLVAESFMEMRPGKAASIVSLLPLEEAAKLLREMDSEQRASVLSKMKPVSAAKIVRYAGYGENGSK